MKNVLFNYFGTFLNTASGEQYEINKVIIFKENKEKVIANYFLDNFSNKEFEVIGEVKRKLKVDLTANYNFIVKAEDQHSWNDKTQYILYLNGDLNNYIFKGLQLNGERLDINFGINNFNCLHCIGWNNKASNKAKYHDFENAYKNINCYCIDNEKMLDYINDLKKAYNNYIKAKEIEKTYTVKDYKKMELASGTTKNENIIMLKNNGLDISGLERNE